MPRNYDGIQEIQEILLNSLIFLNSLNSTDSLREGCPHPHYRDCLGIQGIQEIQEILLNSLNFLELRICGS